MQKYRIVLTPKCDFNKFYQITENVKSIVTDYFMQDGRTVPHITINRFFAEEDELSVIYDKIKDIKLPNFEYEGLTLATKPVGKFVHFLVIGKDIKRYAKQVSETLDLKYDNDEYFPHLSLFSTNEEDDKKIIEVLGDYSFIFNEDIEYKLAIGVSGKVGQVYPIVIS